MTQRHRSRASFSTGLTAPSSQQRSRYGLLSEFRVKRKLNRPRHQLWLLELDPAPVPAQRYDDIKAIFADDKTPADVRAEALQAILSRLPKVHLLVLDAVVSHLKALFESTTTEEDSDLFLTKLGLSVSRCERTSTPQHTILC